jgi:hypothetical protein
MVAALILSPIACTDEGTMDTGAEDTSGDGDGDAGDGDGDGDAGDGDGDAGDGDGDAGDGDGDGDAGDGDGDGDGDPTGEFAPVHELLVAQGCTAGYCHGAGAAGLTMTDAATSYAALVDVDATMAVCGLTKRVVPGDPDQSILWLRVRPAALDGGMPCAVKMPNDGTDNGLPEAEAQLVYDWIAGGALP